VTAVRFLPFDLLGFNIKALELIIGKVFLIAQAYMEQGSLWGKHMKRFDYTIIVR
jgi:hypothetical protein